MNPYAYAGGNPATYNDPSGSMYACGQGCEGGGSGNQQGYYTGIPQLTFPPPTQVNTNNPLTWPKLNPSDPAQDPWYEPFVDDPALDIAGAGLLACPVCLGVAVVGAVVLTLATPTNLSNADLSQPIIPTGPDIQPTKAVDSVKLGHTTVSGGGGRGKQPPKKPTASPPAGDGNGFGKLSGNEYHVTEQGIQTIESHLSRPEFIDSYTGRTALEEPENATMINRLMSALSQGQAVSGADASFYLHELYENTLMGDGMGSVEAHEAALARYEVSPFSIYHSDALLANPGAFGLPYFEFWGLSP